MPSKPDQQAVKWLRSPSNWISLTAVSISVITFFLVYADPGEIRVIAPDRVGVALYKGYISLAATVTFTNTGAPRTVQHITSVTATINPERGKSNKAAEMYWLFERAFVGRREYFSKFPKLEKQYDHDPDNIDFLVFDDRTAPFTLFGGTSVSKVLQFGQESGEKSPFENLDAFEVTFHVKTESSSYHSRTIEYFCNNPDPLIEKSYRWCHAQNL